MGSWVDGGEENFSKLQVFPLARIEMIWIPDYFVESCVHIALAEDFKQNLIFISKELKEFLNPENCAKESMSIDPLSPFPFP